MRIHQIMLGLAAAAVLAGPAWAGKGGSPVVPTLSKATKSSNKAYVGIQWDMMARSSLTGVVGYRSVDVKSDDKVRGAAVEMTFPITGPMAGLGEFRVKGVSGKRGAQGELGLGYSFAHQAFLLNGGIQGSYLYGGVDYLFGPGLKPYIGINSLKRYDKVGPTATCPAGYTLDTAGEFCILLPD